MNALSEGQAAELLRRAGVPEEKIPVMVNIAKRESSLRPGAHNLNRNTGDDSYGLWQINMIDEPDYALGQERLRQFADIGVHRKEDLKDPWKNAQAAARILKGSGLSAWSTYDAAANDPKPVALQGSLDGVLAAASGLNKAAEGLPVASDRAEVARKAASSPFTAAILKLNDEAKGASVGLTAPTEQVNGTSAGNGFQVLEYLTGDMEHRGYREDHSGDNYHEHLAFATADQARRAASLLNQYGIKTTELKGVNPVGRHSDQSYHYAGQAFDVPASQVPVGGERELSRRVRQILGMT